MFQQPVKQWTAPSWAALRNRENKANALFSITSILIGALIISMFIILRVWIMGAAVNEITHHAKEIDETITVIGEDIDDVKKTFKTFRKLSDKKTRDDERLKMLKGLQTQGLATSGTASGSSTIYSGEQQDPDKMLAECEEYLRRLKLAEADFRRLKRNISAVNRQEETEVKTYQDDFRANAEGFKIMLENVVTVATKLDANNRGHKEPNGQGQFRGELAGFDVANFPVLFSSYSKTNNIFNHPLSSMILPLPPVGKIGGSGKDEDMELAAAFVVASFEFIDPSATHRLYFYIDSGKEIDSTGQNLQYKTGKPSVSPVPPAIIQVDSMDLTDYVILSSQFEKVKVGHAASFSFTLLPVLPTEPRPGQHRVGVRISVTSKEAVIPLIWGIVFKE